MPFDIQCVTDFAGAPAAEEWQDLLGHSAAHPVFLSRAFQQAWADAFCRCADCNCQLNILILREGGTLVAVAPFYLSVEDAMATAEERARARDWQRVVARAEAARMAGDAPEARTARAQQAEAAETEPPAAAPRRGERVLRLAGGVAVSDYLDIIAPVGREVEIWAAVLDYWAARATCWDVLDLHSLAASARAVVLAALDAPNRDWAVWSGVEETTPRLSLPGDWESYLERLNKKDRHELRRKVRRAEAGPLPLTWKLYADGPEMAGAFEEFIELHRLSEEAKAQFMTPAMAGFFRSLPAAFAGSGRLEIATLYAGDRPVAAYLSFRQDGELLLYNSGYDPALRDLGAGFVLLVYRIGRAIEQGIGVLDFLRGDERYKYDLGATDQFIYRVIIRK